MPLYTAHDEDQALEEYLDFRYQECLELRKLSTALSELTDNTERSVLALRTFVNIRKARRGEHV